MAEQLATERHISTRYRCDSKQPNTKASLSVAANSDIRGSAWLSANDGGSKSTSHWSGSWLRDIQNRTHGGDGRIQRQNISSDRAECLFRRRKVRSSHRYRVDGEMVDTIKRWMSTALLRIAQCRDDATVKLPVFIDGARRTTLTVQYPLTCSKVYAKLSVNLIYFMCKMH